MNRKLAVSIFGAIFGGWLLLGCAGLSAGVDTARSFVYAKGAKLGNDYCEVKDPALASDIEGRLNTGLRAEGAKFTVDGAINCDP